jgi:hypothetical protein
MSRLSPSPSLSIPLSSSRVARSCSLARRSQLMPQGIVHLRIITKTDFHFGGAFGTSTRASRCFPALAAGPDRAPSDSRLSSSGELESVQPIVPWALPQGLRRVSGALRQAGGTRMGVSVPHRARVEERAQRPHAGARWAGPACRVRLGPITSHGRVKTMCRPKRIPALYTIGWDVRAIGRLAPPRAAASHVGLCGMCL